MKILLTGGAGFIASHIADAFINLGHQVVIVDNLSSGRKEFVNPKAVFYRADITNRKEIEEIIAKEKPEIIDHHAAQMSVRFSVEDPANDANVNLTGLLNLLEAGRKHNLKKVIFASSGGAVYGDAQILPTPESYTPLQPVSPYGISKLASEYYLYFYYLTYGIEYTALRYSNVYGPRQNPHGEAGVVAIFSNKLLGGESPVINGNGLQTRDYVYIGDVVEANSAALLNKAVGAFNIGTGKETNVVDLFKKIRRITGASVDADHWPAKKGEQKRSCLDISVSRKVLKWNPLTPLDRGLKLTVSYFLKHE